MPTGYTSDIYNNRNVTLKDYIMLCARNFGVLIHMKEDSLDAPIPDKIEPSDYYLKRAHQLEEKHKFIKENKKTDDELYAQYKAEFYDEVNKRAEREKETYELKDRYLKMIKEVEDWEVPSSDYDNLKKFALSQLRDSLDFDCKLYEFKFPSFEEWKAEKFDTERIQKQIDDAYEDYRKDVKDAERRTKYLNNLRASLDNAMDKKSDK